MRLRNDGVEMRKSIHATSMYCRTRAELLQKELDAAKKKVESMAEKIQTIEAVTNPVVFR